MVLFFTPVTSGVITGVAAPINSSTLLAASRGEPHVAGAINRNAVQG
jgi:hypothetical protein